MKLVREIDRLGNVKVILDKLYIYENKPISNYHKSRELTGTTAESGTTGIFAEAKTRVNDTYLFWFGKHTRLFTFNTIDYEKDPLDQIAGELKTRIEKIRDWVNSFKDLKEEVEFEISSFKEGYVGEVKKVD